MYYYGGYQGYGAYPQTGSCNSYSNGINGGAIILVLFILLVIVIGSRAFESGRR